MVFGSQPTDNDATDENRFGRYVELVNNRRLTIQMCPTIPRNDLAGKRSMRDAKGCQKDGQDGGSKEVRVIV